MEKIEYKKYSLKEVLGYYTVAIHCPTEKSLLKLVNLLKRKRIFIEGLSIPIEQWWQKGSSSVIYISKMGRGYSDLIHAKKQKHHIVSVYDLLFSESRAYVLRYLV
jgi:hypothetical protein